MTVIEYVLSRLYDLGIKDIFGVPGDYAFPVNDAVCADNRFRWLGNCNELNAAYAADGYARIHGMAALCTTYGVGELSAINGIAGAYAEYLPVFHLVGMPPNHLRETAPLIHHTLGNGDFDTFRQMAKPVVCAHTVLTPENCIEETGRLISAACRERRPVYIGIPSDSASQQIVQHDGKKTPVAGNSSDPVMLKAAAEAVVTRIMKSRQVCLLPGMQVRRFGGEQHLLHLVTQTGLPFATMIMDKGILDETHPAYIGMYCGRLMNEPVRHYVESCDCVIRIGAQWGDASTGGFTAQLSENVVINIMPSSVSTGDRYYPDVLMTELLELLSILLPVRKMPRPVRPDALKNSNTFQTAISMEGLCFRWQQMFRSQDRVFVETGNVALGMAFAALPKGVTFHNQSQWGSIGWATPAALGAALAAPEDRVILLTGEGSHQLTVQEISQFYRYGLKPLIFVLNNDGYLIERQLCRDGEAVYNDVAQWNYTQLPEALGCRDWFIARVSTWQALDNAIQHAQNCGTGAYIEVVTGRYAGAPLGKKLSPAQPV